MFKNLPSLDCEIVNFGKGDIVMAISDGVIEAVGQKGNQFEKRYDTLINKFAKEKSFNLTNKLEKVLTNFQDHTQVQDDISSLFVEFNN